MSTLIVTRDTLLKTKPAQSSTLSELDKAPIGAGEYGISIAETESGHFKISLDNEIAGRKDWFVFQGHATVVDAGTLVVKNDTIFKKEPVQSSQLKDDQKVQVSAQELAVKSFSNVGIHLKVELVNPIADSTSWYVYEGHVETLHIESYAAPKDPPPPAKPVGKLIRIAGMGKTTTRTPIFTGANFTWGEATKDGTRLPVNERITNNIVRMAKEMQKIRERFDNRSITITSWYRPPAVNRAIGGSSRSTHMQGHGVDFLVAGISPREVQRQLEYWNGGLGYGRTFTHIDNRGYRARWNYG
ncbi:MAG: D-Ala-D-Ala carboxypeptidase family metallohydrolase [Cyanobacteria bacterium P01_G01_bin.54]